MFAHVENTGSADLSHLLSTYTHIGEEGLFSEPMAMEAFGPMTKKATDALGSFGAKISLNTSVGFGGTGWVPRAKGEVGSGQTIVLQAICKVKLEKMAEFMTLSVEVDRLVEDEEPGMYVHVLLRMCLLTYFALDRCRLYHVMAQSTEDPSLFTWTEIYADEAAMFAHLEHCGAADLAPMMAILPPWKQNCHI